MKDKILVISRYHRDDDNSIYNAFLKGISSVKEIVFIDYFDEYSIRGKVKFENYIRDILEKENIKELFFMFVWADVTLDLDFIYEITQNRITYMVFWDLEQHFEIIDRYYAQCADLVFLPSNDYTKVFELYDIPSVWTFSLFDKDKYVLELNKDIDVSFIGDLNKGNRKEYLEFLQQNGINVEIYGAGSPNGKVSFSKMVEILNRSKISLNFSDIFDNDKFSYYKKINNRVKQNKGRVVEVCMGGALLMTEDSPGLKDIINIENISLFSSKEELLEKIKFYLQNENERIKKSTNAQNEVIDKYEALNLAKYLTISKPKNKIYFKDKDFLKIYRTFHYYYFLRFLLNKRFQEAYDELKIFYKGIYLKEAFRYSKYHVHKIISQRIKFILNKKEAQKYKKEIERNIPKQKVYLYPSGDETSAFIYLFNPNFVEIIDDYKDEYKSLKEVDKNSLILITNYRVNQILEQNLKDDGFQYINPFKNVKFNIFRESIYYLKVKQVFRNLSKRFDPYEGI